MKRIAIFCLLFLPVVAWAQKQYYLPTAGAADDEKEKPMIEVWLHRMPRLPFVWSGSMLMSGICMETAKVLTS